MFKVHSFANTLVTAFEKKEERNKKKKIHTLIKEYN